MEKSGSHTGRIVKALSGFYYVAPEGSDEVFQCRAKGIFRKKNLTPLVGDRVNFSLTGSDEVEGNVTEILPRKNELIRPRAANIDQALVIFSVHTPEPELSLLDRFLIGMEKQGIKVILIFNKEDLKEEEEESLYRRIYAEAGVELKFTSALFGTGVEDLRKLLQSKLTAVAGPSGAGKSSLINALSGSEKAATGELSKKIGRGKQTTRHTELIGIGQDSYIIDTPGFSSLDLPKMDPEELSDCFPEIRKYKGQCFYKDCSHLNEPGCAVREKLDEGLIPQERYESYSLFYKELNR